MNSLPLTSQGAERLREELKRLKTVDRPRIIDAIAEARAHGDLSENAEYHAAREQQSFAEGRISEIESKLSHANIIDVASLDAGGKVVFGATVDLADEDSGEELDELSLSVPLLGKTGTANRYTNASFFGYLPAPNDDGSAMQIDNGYGVGVYVGYDNNLPMRRGSTRITGAAGALPTWTTIVNAIVQSQGFTEALDPVDLSFYGLAIERKDMGQKNLLVLRDYGGQLKRPLEEADPQDRYLPSIITFGVEDDASGFGAARSFAPYWLNQKPPVLSGAQAVVTPSTTSTADTGSARRQ